MTLTQLAPPAVQTKPSRAKVMAKINLVKVAKDRQKPSARKWTVGKDPALSIFSFVESALGDQIERVRHGLPSFFVVEMSTALAMPRSNFLDSLQLPRSTIEQRIKKNTLLTPSEGDAVLRAAKALAKAQDVFEDRAMASAWLKREIRSLGGVSPVSLMDTDSGFELVMTTLGRIEHGVVA